MKVWSNTCRTAVISNINGEDGCSGRGNIAPVTINLPRIALLTKNIEAFFELLDKRLNQAKDNLLYRYDVLKKLKTKDLPFNVGQKLMKGSENLGPNDSIEPVLKQGTWGIGFIGIAETCKVLMGKYHSESEMSEILANRIVKYIRDYCDKVKEEYKLNFACYASPAEGLSYRFMNMDRKKFGEIEGVTDHGFYSNSFHCPVFSKISIAKKMKIESPFHSMCNGGHISYLELDNYPSPEEIMHILTRTFDNTDIHYLAINFHIKYCKECGTYLNEDETKCHSCGSEDLQGISRVTGYLSLDERFGKGKANERAHRVSHMNGEKVYRSVK